MTNPHATLRQSGSRFEPLADKKNTNHSRGEKWWGLEGVRNPNLTAQPPLLDGAEGELLSPVATVTVEGTTNGASGNQSMAATPMVSGGHALAVPPPGSMAGPLGWDHADTPHVLYTGLEPSRLKATGEQVTGADTPRHCIENKRRQWALLTSQKPHTQWRIYQGGFDLPYPVAPLETHWGKMCPAGLALHHPAANILKEWATYGCPTQTGKPWTRKDMQSAIERGPHRSALSDEAIAHFKAEVGDKVRSGQAKLVA